MGGNVIRTTTKEENIKNGKTPKDFFFARINRVGNDSCFNLPGNC